MQESVQEILPCPDCQEIYLSSSVIVSDSSDVQHFVYTAMNRNHSCSINILCLFALHSWSKCFEISNRCLFKISCF